MSKVHLSNRVVTLASQDDITNVLNKAETLHADALVVLDTLATLAMASGTEKDRQAIERYVETTRKHWAGIIDDAKQMALPFEP